MKLYFKPPFSRKNLLFLPLIVGAIAIIVYIEFGRNGSNTPLIDMVLIPEGYFDMGCNEEVDSSCDAPDEKPFHRIYLDRFYIDRYEVTVNEYNECVRAGRCKQPGRGEGCNFWEKDKGDHPINCVNIFDARDFCNWKGKRLPTEAEWEKSARGTDGRRFPWGNSLPNGDNANLCDRRCELSWKDNTIDDGWAATSPVGSYPAGVSPYGVYDMAGNVWEWVNDIYDSNYYNVTSQKNPKGPPGEVGERICRGGSYISMPKMLRTSLRFRSSPEMRKPYLGFRCAKD